MTDKPNTMPDGALTADDRAAIVRRHFTVMEDEQQFTRHHFAHAVCVGPVLSAAFGRIKQDPHSGTTALEVLAPIASKAVPVSAESQSLRELLGLT